MFDINIWFVAKLFVLFGLLVYIVFSFVMVKQVGLMLDTLDVNFEKPVRFIAYAHLLFSLFVFLLSIVIL